MNSLKNLYRVLLAMFGFIVSAGLASAADYADVAAATTAVSDIPDTVSPIYLAFLTLSVGAFIIGMIVRFAKRGASTR